jgi:alkylated DNA repair protein alkB family protein 4
MDAPLPLPLRLATRPDESDPWVAVFDFTTQTAERAPEFEGLCILRDFLSEEEALALLGTIEQQDFSPAQSGKLKQHYGARVNFNKRRINAKKFEGLPAYGHAIEARLKTAFSSIDSSLPADRLRRNEALADFEATDLFVLRYEVEEASNLDFHIDDTFAYGEGIFDVSLESDSVLTFIRRNAADEEPVECVRAALPARSAAFLYGTARYEWEHAILPYDIEARRTSLTLRTLSPAVRESEEGRRILDVAREIVPLRSKSRARTLS